MISQQDLSKWHSLCNWLDQQSGKFALVFMLYERFPDCDLYQIYSPARKELWLQHQIQLLKWCQKHPLHKTTVTGWQLCPDWRNSLAYLDKNLPNNYDLVLGGQAKRSPLQPRIGGMVLGTNSRLQVVLSTNTFLVR